VKGRTGQNRRLRLEAGNVWAVLDWDHNAYYHRLLLRQIPQRCQRVLDVGCGAGSFAAELAQRSEQVDALDRSAEMIEEAKVGTPGNVNCVLADVLADPLPGKDYDAILSISALHHMPLQNSLPVLAAARQRIPACPPRCLWTDSSASLPLLIR
jgi:2-polyprenyl-3-methyl-5-hydroxy-6-metoxy-1,4-benzoquinol methylase